MWTPSCTQLAAALSASYRTYETYDPSNHHYSSLESFLEKNGILLTMCMRFNGQIPWLECTGNGLDVSPFSFNGHDEVSSTNEKKKVQEKHRIASSWIQQNISGFRVVSPPVDTGPPVGHILQPNATTIQCLYPMDAATINRDDEGCGPLSSDIHDGSKGYDHAKWYGKLLLKGQIIEFKNSMFGNNRAWDSIPCSEFLGSTAANFSSAVLGEVNNDDRSWTYQRTSEYIIQSWSYIMGHNICNTSQPLPTPSFNDTDFLVYIGPTSWQPQHWEEMLDLMKDTLGEHPNVQTWNEITLHVSADMLNDAVQAVFYVKGGIDPRRDELARRIGISEARKLHKPLLYVNAINDRYNHSEADLFQCNASFLTNLRGDST
mmetsp:Transcript_24419/g.37136  ORF Transcript_24419/g.37136 Transcript_24419/m.37136 type:complete len:375 (-) Transcript_24419:288-1412(-)|eukprot:CAMPEP_0178936350 /NCGR_PEP_ID=MMETSP0786-20121207/25129_1 /TAXON_ID=186022 /ORGANISM="Thalassionema frauenfeldii, Strain CCMP 1798" /LENGTH=374 /DNA_ID=CAMNT_0020614753 /DNA_START=74 /DNA_END=1198 /DNA_ORIENTATION=+